MSAGLAILGRGYHDGMWDYCGREGTGQNLVWLAGIQVCKAVLEHDSAQVALHVARLFREIRVAENDEEGIKPDNSFWQHGAQLYAGGSGIGFSVDCARWAFLCHGTRFAMPDEALNILSAYILDGQVWMCRGGTFDYGAVGRELKRGWDCGASRKLGHACAYLARIPDKRQDGFAGARSGDWREIDINRPSQVMTHAVFRLAIDRGGAALRGAAARTGRGPHRLDVESGTRGAQRHPRSDLRAWGSGDIPAGGICPARRPAGRQDRHADDFRGMHIGAQVKGRGMKPDHSASLPRSVTRRCWRRAWTFCSMPCRPRWCSSMGAGRCRSARRPV